MCPVLSGGVSPVTNSFLDFYVVVVVLGVRLLGTWTWSHARRFDVDVTAVSPAGPAGAVTCRYSQNKSFLSSVAYPFLREVAAFYQSYMVKELANGTGTGWMGWPRRLGSFPNGSLPCPARTIGPAGYCIVPVAEAGALCEATPGCAAVAITADDGWDGSFPGAAYLGAGPVVASVADFGSWASFVRPLSEAGDTGGRRGGTGGAGHHPHAAGPAGPAGTYTWNVPKSCSMELCTLGGQGVVTTQRNPTAELALVRRVLTAASSFALVLGVDGADRAVWADIVRHLAPVTATSNGSAWVWAETNLPAAKNYGANAWYPLAYYAPIHPGQAVGLREADADPDAFKLGVHTVGGMNPSTGEGLSFPSLSLPLSPSLSLSFVRIGLS